MPAPDVRRVLRGTSVTHLAGVLPDGAPHFGWLEGDAAWEVVDRISTKYTGGPYPRDVRVVMLIEPDHQLVG